MRSAFLPALSLLIVGGCADPDSQDVDDGAASVDDPIGTYELTAINGESLPVYVGSYNDCREYAAAGTLELAADGRYAFETTMREECGGEPTEREAESEVGTYTVDGQTVRLAEEAIERPELNRYSDGNQTDGDDIPVEDLGGTATIDGDQMTIQLQQTSDTVTLRRQ